MKAIDQEGRRVYGRVGPGEPVGMQNALRVVIAELRLRVDVREPNRLIRGSREIAVREVATVDLQRAPRQHLG